MKLNKIFLPFLAVAALSVGACTDEVEYTPAEPAPVTDFYFPTTNMTEYSLLDGTTSFSLTVARPTDKGEATVAVDHTISPEGAFTFPESVTFADGQSVATYTVKYDLSQVEVDVHYTVTLSLPGVENTPYSYGSMTLDVLYLPWTDLGKGWYQEGALQSLFGFDPLEYQVPIQAHPKEKGVYRLVNPYDPEICEYTNYLGDYDDSSDHYMVIDASNPEKVVVRAFFTGIISPYYDEIDILSFAYYYAATNQAASITPDMYAHLVNGVITFDEGAQKTMMIGMTNEGSYSYFYGNRDNTFRVVLPGYERPQPWEDLGWCDYTDGLYGPAVDRKFEGNTYKVFVQKHKTEPGMYRMVNPFAAESGYDGANGYLIINAADPDCVLIGEYKTGITSEAAGDLMLCTQADFEMIYNKTPFADVKDAEIGGVLKDGVITISGENGGSFRSRTQKFRASGFETKLDLNSAELPEWDPAEPETESLSSVAKKMVKKAQRVF